MNVFPFIEAEKAEQRNVAKACELLEVSRSAFYDWHQHTPSARQVADEELAERIQEIYDDSKGTYGWPRVHQALWRDGVCVRRERVARIMRRRGLVGRCRRRWTKTTISDPGIPTGTSRPSRVSLNDIRTTQRTGRRSVSLMDGRSPASHIRRSAAGAPHISGAREHGSGRQCRDRCGADPAPTSRARNDGSVLGSKRARLFAVSRTECS